MKRVSDIQAVKASTCWRELLAHCLWDGERIEDIVSNLTPEEWDERWAPGMEGEAPALRAWSDDYIFFSTNTEAQGLMVWRAPRNPEAGATKYQAKGDHDGR